MADRFFSCSAWIVSFAFSSINYPDPDSQGFTDGRNSMGRKDGMFTVQFIYPVCSAGEKKVKLPVPCQTFCITKN